MLDVSFIIGRDVAVLGINFVGVALLVWYARLRRDPVVIPAEAKEDEPRITPELIHEP